VRSFPFLAGALAAAGCAVFDADPEPLAIVASAPRAGARHPAAEPLRVRFDRYLDPRLAWDAAVTLSSADVAVGIDVGYDPAGPDLVVIPRLALRPGLGYRLTIAAGAVRGVDGSELDDDVEIGFLAEAGGAAPPPAPVDFERDLAPLFARECGCHGPEPAVHPPLTAGALLTLAPQRDPELPFVEPGAPLRSLLVLKVLPGYPGLLGEEMPPDHPLAPDEIRRIVEWVRALR
jgi:hypothetical protein